MPWPKKPLVSRKCNYCSKIVWVTNKRAQYFKFCSNTCKYETYKQKIPKNKLPIHKLTFVKCRSELCNKGRYYRTWQLRIQPNPFCSRACYVYSMSKDFKLDLEAIKEQKQFQTKLNIWGRF